MANDQNLRDRYERRKSALTIERASFITHWRDLSQFVQPRRGRFFIDDVNKGGDRYQAIINSKATQAWKVARSGLLAGSMSPTRPWFKLETTDADLNKYQPVKDWFFKTANLIMTVLTSSNCYQQSPQLLGEMILFGTGAMMHVDDYEDVARFYTLTAGSYMIAQNERCEVDTIIREWKMTTMQIMALADKAGGKVSQAVKNAYDTGNYDAWFPVTHIIEPNAEYDGVKMLSKYKKFRSCIYECGNEDKNAMLSDKGFDSFPAYVPRWETTGEDVYGTDCPAMTALGDIKGLQIEERRKAQAIDKMVSPPLRGPASVRNVPIDTLPGGATLYDDGGGSSKLEPLYAVNPQVQELRLDIGEVEKRIDTAFYVHLFRAISDMAGVQPRNELELNKRDQERLLELGPTLEHLHGELLAPLVERTFQQCATAGILPPAPPELQGRHVRTRFISALALAQRSIAAGSIERAATFVAGQIGAGLTGAARRYNDEAAMEEYFDAIGAPPSLIKSDEQVAAEDAQRAQQQQQAMAAQNAGVMADAASKGAGAVKTLGEAHAQPGSALDAVLKTVNTRATAGPNVFAR